MTLIDWSDPQEMLGLLVEYVSDERTASTDAARSMFLDNLLQELEGVANLEPLGVDGAVERLREILDSQLREFERDEVLAHVHACIEELARIKSQGAS